MRDLSLGMRPWVFVLGDLSFRNELSGFQRESQLASARPIATLQCSASHVNIPLLTPPWRRLAAVDHSGLSPGPVATEMNTALMQNPELNQQFLLKIPVGRWGRVEEIGHLALYLCSEGLPQFP